MIGADRGCVLFETTVVNGCTIVHDPTETHHTHCPDAYQGHKKLPGPRVNLSWANLPGANLVEANLVGTQLVHAVLSRANLTLANLAGANLTGANLSGVYDLTYVKGNNTTCSDGSNSSSHGGTCEGHLSPAP
jgi:uncharacterized protein YjbI with pentapeptide repeats